MKFGTNITSLEANPYMYHMAVMQTCEVGAIAVPLNVGTDVVIILQTNKVTW
jgi:hypothetical protein